MPASLPPGLPIVPNGPDDGGDGGDGAKRDHAPFPMSETDFEAAVSDALDQIPPELAKTMNNVAIFIEDDYTPQPGEDPDTVLLGLYEGVPLTERGLLVGRRLPPGPHHDLPAADPGHLRIA